MTYREPGCAGTVRFFCPVNDTPLSELARAYVDSFVVLGYRVRVIATRMADLAAIAGGPWQKHRGLFLTPIEGRFTNVVCGEPFDWHRLYTANVKNVLIASSPPAPDAKVPGLKVASTNKRVGVIEDEGAIAVQVAARYDAIVVPSMQISSEWNKLDLFAYVVPTDIGLNGAVMHLVLNASSLPTREQPQEPSP